jgi:hypothetical protein
LEIGRILEYSGIGRSENGRSKIGRLEIGRSENGHSENGRSENGRSEIGQCTMHFDQCYAWHVYAALLFTVNV